jgi:hypothetical protein
MPTDTWGRSKTRPSSGRRWWARRQAATRGSGRHAAHAASWRPARSARSSARFTAAASAARASAIPRRPASRVAPSKRHPPPSVSSPRGNRSWVGVLMVTSIPTPSDKNVWVRPIVPLIAAVGVLAGAGVTVAVAQATRSPAASTRPAPPGPAAALPMPAAAVAPTTTASAAPTTTAAAAPTTAAPTTAGPTSTAATAAAGTPVLAGCPVPPQPPHPPPPPPWHPAVLVPETSLPPAAAPAPWISDLHPITGKGMWIWEWSQTESGNARAVVNRAVSAGLSQIWVRVGDSPDGFYGAAELDALVPAAHAAGISVIAWGFPYLYDPIGDAAWTESILAWRSPGGERVDGFSAYIERST